MTDGVRTDAKETKTNARRPEAEARKGRQERLPPELIFENVYDAHRAAKPYAVRFLYELLQERHGLTGVNISHRRMPSRSQHERFVGKLPYRYWYLIQTPSREIVGAIYLSKQNEIGIHLIRRFWGQGIGPAAIKMLMKRHPQKRFLANINPANERSRRMFEGFGFRKIQETYELSM